MRRILLPSLVFFVLSLFVCVLPTTAQNNIGENIILFDQTTIINSDGTIDVTEKITYDFGNEQRHGIFRTIPYTTLNKDGKKYKMTFENFSVVDEFGVPYTFTQSDESGKIALKVGDPDSTITGQHVYEIRYRVSGALTYFSDHDELYWNVTGNEWEVPIANVQSSIQLPSTIDPQDISEICYRGEKGDSNECATAVVGNTAIFETAELGNNEGMTVVVGFPKGHVAVLEPTLITDFFETFVGRLVLIGMMIAGLFWYIVFPLWIPFKWWREGRDPKHISTGVVQAWFDPPRLKADRPLGEKNNRFLSPAEVGTLIDERVDLREIVALLIHLAQRGYIKIHEIKKGDFELIKMDNATLKGDLMSFEEKMLTGMFLGKIHVRLKDKKLATLVSSIQNMIYAQTVRDGYFPDNPETIRKKYSVIAGVAAFTFNFFLAISASIFGRIMPRKTLDGVHAANTAKSLKNFLVSQERQLEFQADRKMMFEKLLPYAIAFGVEKIWASRFKDLKLNSEWFQSSSSNVLTAYALTNSLHSSFARSFQSAATPVSSSTGHSSGFSGGSSGGGGGGGGG